MKETTEKIPGVDWALVLSILFWVIAIAVFVGLISFGRTTIPQPALEVIEASGSRNSLIIAHRNGDPVWLANTQCIWTPDISRPDVAENAGSLVLVGKERKEGRVSILEPNEMAKCENELHLKEGGVGKIRIVDVKSGQQIFSQIVNVTE